MPKYFVDSATGNNKKDGLTPETAWKTLDRWTPAANDEVRIEKGDGTPYTMADKIRVGPVKLDFDPDAPVGAITGGAAKGMHCIRMELPFEKRNDARGTVISGGKFGECTSTNLWFGFANGVTVTKTEQVNAGWCNTHFTACDDFTFTFNKCARPHGQHNVYGGNSLKNPVITDNELYHADDAAVHLNGDITTSLGIFPKQADGITPVPECTGMIINPVVARNLMFDCGWDGTGGGATGDGVTSAVYEDNIIVSKGWGINVYAQDGFAESSKVTIQRNTIQSHFTCFNLTGVVDGRVLDNTLSPEKVGDLIDLANTPSPGLIQKGNTETRTPFTDGQLALWASAFSPPPPPPLPPPPPPPPPPLPDIDVSKAITVTTADLALVDFDNQGQLWEREWWKKQDGSGPDYNLETLWVYNENWNFYFTPVGGAARDQGGCSFAVDGFLVFPQDTVVEFRAIMTATHQFTFGGVTVGEGSGADGGDTGKHYVKTFLVPGNKPISIGWKVISGGSWMATFINFRLPGEAEYRPLPMSMCYPPLKRPPVQGTVPPVVPLPPPPPGPGPKPDPGTDPTPGTGVITLTREETIALMMR